jgi:hypothetical protein
VIREMAFRMNCRSDTRNHLTEIAIRNHYFPGLRIALLCDGAQEALVARMLSFVAHAVGGLFDFRSKWDSHKANIHDQQLSG